MPVLGRLPAYALHGAHRRIEPLLDPPLAVHVQATVERVLEHPVQVAPGRNYLQQRRGREYASGLDHTALRRNPAEAPHSQLRTTRKRDEAFEVARVAAHPGKPPLKLAAAQEVTELARDEARQTGTVGGGGGLRQEPVEVCAHDVVQHGLGRRPWCV